MEKLGDDKYSLAIKKDEKMKNSLNNKKDRLERRTKKLKDEKKSLEYHNIENARNLEEADRLKDYHINKDSYKKKFFKKALKFGIGCSIGFTIFIVLFIMLMFKMDPNYILNIKPVVGGNLAIGSLMVSIEYLNVSRDFRSLVAKRKEKDNKHFIVVTKEEVENNKTLIKELEIKISDLGIDINDLNLVIEELDSRILEYRTKRNNLIENLVNGLDNHIEGFEYEMPNIDKIKEKKRTNK